VIDREILSMYLCVALQLGIIQRTGAGVAINAVFEVLFGPRRLAWISPRPCAD